MNLYSFDADYIAEKLLPPLLRTPKRLDWLKTLLIGLQLKWNDVFDTEGFKKGFIINKWSSVTAYTAGNNVRFGIAVYKAAVNNTGIVPTSDPDTWILIETDFVGSDARVPFNGQKMVFEYLLNKYLNVSPTTVPKIYITNNTVDVNGFYMGVDGDGGFGEMGINSNQDDFLGTSYTLGQTAFTIFVPIALANTFTSEAPNVAPAISANRENIVRGVADKYSISGILYNVITY